MWLSSLLQQRYFGDDVKTKIIMYTVIFPGPITVRKAFPGYLIVNEITLGSVSTRSNISVAYPRAVISQDDFGSILFRQDTSIASNFEVKRFS